MHSLAYLILAHNDPPRVARLLSAIDDPDNFYAIHIDARAAREVHQAIAEQARRRPNIRIIRSRAIHWGGWSLVQATLDAINVLLSISTSWQWFINLSAQDYPLKTQRQIRAKLAQQPDRIFMDCRPVNEPLRWSRLNYFHVEAPSRVYRLPIHRDIARRWTPYWGSQWFIGTRAFSEYAVSRAAGPFRRYFRHTSVPDEFFFQTLAMNSPFRDQIVPDNLRLIEWEPDSAGRLSHHPRILTGNDLPRLLGSDCLLARKFDGTVDAAVLDRLDEHLKSVGRAAGLSR